MMTRQYRLMLLLLLSLLLAACARTARPDTPEQPAGTGLEVHFFRAGSADAILLTTAHSAVLVDTGEKGFGKEILSYLEEKGIDRLDLLLITHFDKDHIGGAAKVINNIAIGAVLQSSRPKDSDEYAKYIKALSETNIEPVTVRGTCAYTFDGVRYEIDPPRQEKYGDDASNNSSLIVSVQNGASRFLLMGDAQTERIAEFLADGHGTYDVLKVPHHGREEPLMAELARAVSPQYAIITSSEEEPESEVTITILEQSGAQVLLTREGAATIRSDGAALQVSVEE